MYKTHSVGSKISLLISILGPILITQLSISAMNVADTIMSGQASTNDLAGVAIGSSLWMPVFTGLGGILYGITPIISQLKGAENLKEIPFIFFQSIYLAVIISIVLFFLGLLSVHPILIYMGLSPEVRAIASHYLLALSIGIIPLFMYTVCRNFIDAHGITRMTMMITLLGLPVNVCLNYVFIFGTFGFPRLGGVGAGIATAMTYWLMAIISFIFLIKGQPFFLYHLGTKLYPISIKIWKKLLIIGVPIGLSIFLETSIFSAITLLMSEFDTVIIAAHQAALNVASLLYMVPYSISMAMTISVSFEIGAKRVHHAALYSQIGIIMAVSIGLIFSFGLFFTKGSIAHLYASSPQAVKMIQHFLLYAIFFQLSDAVAAPIQGALRGYKDVNVTFIVALISYWGMGLPCGLLLLHLTDLGPFSYWIGLIIGLALGAVFLFIRLIYIQKKYRNQEVIL
ncbi:MATE family efflux transporter [Terrilactibacillus sp. BCM23-1]|uniref:Probable multidrug resistance protein NorM n=1 Tax=Terrilactibacillus tamarindi TaxID=2599694 RepID=A0A6N8CS94_9BACI|nr:MATE family efflux transporter [Terrilactibacillus tamarindi]MTT32921.1 MATE family efflux transporter [Terrilactibacillus tamarindi]